MRPRAASSLASLGDRKLFESLSEGMALLAEHALSLESAVSALEQPDHPRAAGPLRALAEEEAAKFLILLDAARCPRKQQQLRADQLDRFHDHLAKGIYVEVYDMSPADYAEVRKYVETLRQSHYLDGPNDVDWVFRNPVIARREEGLYVDYIEDDQGGRWHSPSSWDDLGLRTRSAVLQLVAAMDRAEFATAAGLECVARVWRDLVLEDRLRWQEIEARSEKTLEEFRLAGLAKRATSDDLHEIVETWSFPLHALDLRFIPVGLESLREEQRAWTPEG